LIYTIYFSFIPGHSVIGMKRCRRLFVVAGYGKKRQWEFSKLPFQIPILLPTIVINPGIAENDEDILFGCIHALTESFDPAKIPVSTSPFSPRSILHHH